MIEIVECCEAKQSKKRVCFKVELLGAETHVRAYDADTNQPLNGGYVCKFVLQDGKIRLERIPYFLAPNPEWKKYFNIECGRISFK